MTQKAGPIARAMGGLLEKAAARLSKKGVFSFGQELVTSAGGLPIGNMRISTDSLFTIWRSHADVFSCVRELAQNTGSNGYYWVNTKDEDADPNAEQVKIAEAILNSLQTFRVFKERLIRDVSVAGNSYTLLQKSQGSGKVIGLQPIDPRTLSVITDQYGNIKRWVQNLNGVMQTFEPDEILHWKLVDDPNSCVFGLSPLEPIVFEIRTDLAAMVSNYVFFQNDAQPAAQYILEEGTTDDESKIVIKQIQDQLKGAENRHKSLIMSKVKEIKQMSISQKDMEFHVLRRFTTEKVCSALGVPKSILNYTDDVNYGNGQEQTKKFWEGTIAPLEENVREFINKRLLVAIGVTDIRIEFNEKKFDSREYIETSTREDVKHGILTINEAREARGYQKYDALDAGEYVDKPIIYQGIAAVPVTDVGIDPAELPPLITDQQTEEAVKRLERLAERASPYASKPPKKGG